MWLQEATREDLLNIVQSDRLADRPLHQVQSLKEILESSSELQFLWKEDPRKWDKLPSIIILEKLTPREFFAWTGTYLHNCRPITAYCRVAHRETIQATIDSQPSFGLGKMETICIGLIIGEAATYIAGQLDVNRLSMTAFAGTYSFAVTRALAGNLFPYGRENLSELWSNARRLTGQKPLSLTLDDLDRVWKTIYNISEHRSVERLRSENGFRVIESACRQIAQIGEITESDWKDLTRGLFEKDIPYELLKGPREERVLQVEHALTSLCQQNTSDTMKLAFIGGYLASRISPGTFDHHELLLPYLPKIPSVLLWYGLCAGLPNDSKLRNFGSGIGRRIVRDAVQEDTILNRPKCDIGISELEVLFSGNNSAQNFYPKESGNVIVEIHPCINCTMRNNDGRKIEPDRKAIQQTIFPDYDYSALKNLLTDLDRSLKSVDKIRDRIGEITGNSERKKGRERRGKTIQE